MVRRAPHHFICCIFSSPFHSFGALQRKVERFVLLAPCSTPPQVPSFVLRTISFLSETVGHPRPVPFGEGGDQSTWSGPILAVHRISPSRRTKRGCIFFGPIPSTPPKGIGLLLLTISLHDTTFIFFFTMHPARSFFTLKVYCTPILRYARLHRRCKERLYIFFFTSKMYNRRCIVKKKMMMHLVRSNTVGACVLCNGPIRDEHRRLYIFDVKKKMHPRFVRREGLMRCTARMGPLQVDWSPPSPKGTGRGCPTVSLRNEMVRRTKDGTKETVWPEGNWGVLPSTSFRRCIRALHRSPPHRFTSSMYNHFIS